MHFPPISSMSALKVYCPSSILALSIPIPLTFLSSSSPLRLKSPPIITLSPSRLVSRASQYSSSKFVDILFMVVRRDPLAVFSYGLYVEIIVTWLFLQASLTLSMTPNLRTPTLLTLTQLCDVISMLPPTMHPFENPGLWMTFPFHFFPVDLSSIFSYILICVSLVGSIFASVIQITSAFSSCAT